MAILERITRNIDNRYWNPGVDYFPVKNRYTAGVAGQRFFEEIKENGKIYGTRCQACQITFVPARIYCERCFARLEEKDWVDVGTTGNLYSYTAVWQTKSGTKKEEPSIMAAVLLGDSLLFHRLAGCNYADLHIGMPVKAELKAKSERSGSINDISHFKPA